jgi:hypothetical protein
MAIVVVLAFLLLTCVVSVIAPDLRDYDDRDRRGWWPGRTR